MEVRNFFAGPAILAEKVLVESENAIRNFDDMGLSILEISHRSKQFITVMEDAEELVRELLAVPSSHAVLFLTGGASSQFYMAPMNLLASNEKAGYVNTGTWSTKAIAEVSQFGECVELATSKDKTFSYIPKNYSIPSDLRYIHLTSNNTIFGTEMHEYPKTDVPLVADMSSDIFSKPIDVSRFDLIYAGAQKNLGPAGTTLVIVKKDSLGKTGRPLPTMLNYETHIKKGSSFNTPPVFPIYVCMLTLRWLKNNGGIKAMSIRNIEKAELLYNEIDRNSLFYGNVDKEDRSRMNVCFSSFDKSHEIEFLKFAEGRKLVGLKGHRSVGGFRASIYNAMSLEGVEDLIRALQDYEKLNG